MCTLRSTPSLHSYFTGPAILADLAWAGLAELAVLAESGVGGGRGGGGGVVVEADLADLDEH